MKKRRSLFFRLIRFFFILFVLGVGAIFLYVKTSPKLMINNANNLLLYDFYFVYFFPRRREEEN